MIVDYHGVVYVQQQQQRLLLRGLGRFSSGFQRKTEPEKKKKKKKTLSAIVSSERN